MTSPPGHPTPNAGPSATLQPLVQETVVAGGARYRVGWFDPPFLPPPAETTQALGICFTPESQIVLVTWNATDWTLPGGTIEPGETLEQTLTREVWEEACARVRACAYIGCQRVESKRSPPPTLPHPAHLGRRESDSWMRSPGTATT